MAWNNDLSNWAFGDPNAGGREAIGTLGAGYDAALNNLHYDSANAQRMADQLGSQSRQNLQGYDDRLTKMGSAGERLDMADQMRQDANAYERDRASQGVLATYGNDPLSSGTKAGVTAQLAQLARQNYNTALNNANAAIGQNMGALQNVMGQSTGIDTNTMNQKLGIQNNLTEGRSQLATAKANAIASQQAAAAPSSGVLGTLGNIASALF